MPRQDDNWYETQATIQDMSDLLGISPEAIDEFLHTLENLIVHRFLESVPEGSRDYEVAIELPYLGSLVVSKEKGRLSTLFTSRRKFWRKLNQAAIHGTDPLVDQLGEVLGKQLVKKFEEEI